MVSYSSMKRLELSESDLRKYCFPRPHSDGQKARLYNVDKSFNKPITSAFRRTCRRCDKEYEVLLNGRPVRMENCSHHWGKFSEKRGYYYCCKKPRYYPSCSVAPQHVSEQIDPDNLTGFINTRNAYNYEKSHSVYAMDCEMLYTTAGMDVAAVSIVDADGSLVYETFVLPDSPIIDYNTKHSNLTVGQFRGVTTRLKDVHRKLLSLMAKETILVGHGLDHDLLRLKVIHDHVVDTSVLYPHPRSTSVLYPHPRGIFPLRNSLTFLKEKYLAHKWEPGKTKTVLKCRADAQDAMKLACMKC